MPKRRPTIAAFVSSTLVLLSKPLCSVIRQRAAVLLVNDRPQQVLMQGCSGCLGFREVPQVAMLEWIVCQVIALPKGQPIIIGQTPLRGHQRPQTNGAVGTLQD